jgi:DeoR family transcriptional regulator, aga operon transcriptional repressor
MDNGTNGGDHEVSRWSGRRGDGNPPSREAHHWSRVDRFRAILEVVDGSENTVGVDLLAEQLSVSAATVRRDLAHLDAQGLVRRSYGGAVRVGAQPEVPIYYRGSTFATEKRRIGRRAASMVEDAVVVGVTGGTTTMEVARAISSRQGITVVTNALNIGYELARRRNIRLVLTGGVCRPASFELSGPIAENTLAGYHLDVAFVGVDGIHVTAGCTTHDDIEARANHALVARARRAIVVADHSKIGRIAFASICQLAEIHALVTDDAADSGAVAELEAAGLQVALA